MLNKIHFILIIKVKINKFKRHVIDRLIFYLVSI
jgi:hypothetical protein